VDHKLKFKSAKGQLPFVELNGEEIADSAVIISKLSQHFGVDPDAQLTQDEKNSSHALSSMIENHLNWVYVYWRSKNPDAMIKVISYIIQRKMEDFSANWDHRVQCLWLFIVTGIQVEPATFTRLTDSKPNSDIFLQMDLCPERSQESQGSRTWSSLGWGNLWIWQEGFVCARGDAWKQAVLLWWKA